MAAKLVAQYGREEVRVITDANRPRRYGRDDVVMDLFKMGSRTSLLNASMVVCVQRCDWKKELLFAASVLGQMWFIFVNVWIGAAELNEPVAYITLLISRSSPPRTDVGTSALSPAQQKEIADKQAAPQNPYTIRCNLSIMFQ